MSSIGELACRLDTALAKTEHDVGEITCILQAIAAAVHDPTTPQATELADVIFDVFPRLVQATGASPECQVLVERITAAAEAICSPRELWIAVLAAASAAIHASDPAADEPSAAHGPSSASFQFTLLRIMTGCVLGVKGPLSYGYQDELMGVTLDWCSVHLPTVGDPEATVHQLLDAVFRPLIARLYVYPKDSGQPVRVRVQHQDLIAGALLQLASWLTQLPTSLTAADAALQERAEAAKACMGGKLITMQPVVEAAVRLAQRTVIPILLSHMATSLHDGMVQIMETARTWGDAFGSRLLNIQEVRLGAAVVLFCLLTGPDEGSKAPFSPLRPGLFVLGQTGAKLAGCALPLITDRAAEHESVPLAVLGLTVVALAANAFEPLEEDEFSEMTVSPKRFTQETVLALVHIMGSHPEELLRTAAHETLHAVLNAESGAVRSRHILLLLQEEDLVSHTFAMHRIRLELSRENPIYSGQRAMELAVNQVKYHTPGHWDTRGLAQAADMMAAGVNVCRFVVLKGGAIDEESRFARESVRPMCTQLSAAVKQGLGPDSEHLSLSEELALMRLQEALECTIEALGKNM